MLNKNGDYVSVEAAMERIKNEKDARSSAGRSLR